MGRTYVTVRCPYCKKVIEQSSFGGIGRGPRYVGCPIVECVYCKKPHYEDRITEPATKPLKWYVKREPVKWIEVPLKTLFYVSIALAMATYVYDQVAYKQGDLLYLAFGMFLVSLAARLFLMLYNATHTNIVVNEEFEREYAASVERLRDPKYAEMLKKMGAKLPKVRSKYDG